MKSIIIGLLFMLMSGCIMMETNNTIITKTYYDEAGKVSLVELTQELSDDGMYYSKSSETIIAEAKNTCTPNCAPGELANIELSRTLRAVLNKRFVSRGMNGYELANSLGTETIRQTPLGILAFGISKVAEKPNSVSLQGDNNSYSPIEAHFTGNSGDGSSYSSPITYPETSYKGPIQ